MTREQAAFLAISAFCMVVSLVFIVGVGVATAQNQDCIAASPSVEVCGDYIEDGQVHLEVHSSSSVTVAYGVAPSRKREGSVEMQETQLSPGVNNITVANPGTGAARWSLGNMQGWAFGEAGRDLDLGESTWSITALAFVGGAIGTIVSTFIAALTTFYGATFRKRRLW